MWQSHILQLGDGTVLVECGPMRMFIEASRLGTVRPDVSAEAARVAIKSLEEIATARLTLSRPASHTSPPSLGSLAHTMWQAANSVGDSDLTPMAAVAGTIADAAADFLQERGMTRVMVNNGGDLAVRLGPGETVSIGIRKDIRDSSISHRVRVRPEMRVGGITTSGLGGRSFTRGVASAATVFASRAAYADACATALANATDVSSPAVERRLAETIDPETDLKGIEITHSVGELSESEIYRALSQAVEKAERLVDRDLIFGACIFVQGFQASTTDLLRIMEPMES